METKDLLVWKETNTIKVFETDAKKKATFSAIYNYFQEAAYNHAEQVDLRLGKVLPDNNIWMLSRMEIEVDELPGIGAAITVDTWSRGVDRLFFIRDFVIHGPGGRTFMRGVTSWVVVDAVARRVLRPAEAAKRWTVHADKKAIDRVPEKLPELAAGEVSYALQVKYSGLDRNHHVNNGKYIEWVMDSYPIGMLDRAAVKKMEISFISEALYGDRLKVLAQKISDTTYLNSIVREGDGREVCRARIAWIV